jgi:hypothetical protein
MTQTATSERPILFSAEMVRAILDGRKTQTRRVVKPQPSDAAVVARNSAYLCVQEPGDDRARTVQCPYAPGDLLWVREAWRAAPEYDNTKPIDIPDDAMIDYAADSDDCAGHFTWGRWRSPIHLPEHLARLPRLRITEVCVSRVQDISEADAIAEGVRRLGDWWAGEQHPVKKVPKSRESAVAAFRDLWNSINAKRGFGWDANPWVWAITFDIAEARR